MSHLALWSVGGGDCSGDKCVGGAVDSVRHQGSYQSRHQGEPYRRIEVITGPVRRRRWTAEEKARILMESLSPGARISDVGRRHDLNRGLLQAWRRQAERAAADQPVPAFIPVRCGDDATAASAAMPGPRDPCAPPGLIEVEIGRARVRVQGAVDLDALRQILAILGPTRDPAR